MAYSIPKIMFFLYVSISNIMNSHLNSDDGKGVTVKGSPNGFLSVLGIDNDNNSCPILGSRKSRCGHVRNQHDARRGDLEEDQRIFPEEDSVPGALYLT